MRKQLSVEYDIDSKYVSKEISYAQYMLLPYAAVWIIAILIHNFT